MSTFQYIWNHNKIYFVDPIMTKTDVDQPTNISNDPLHVPNRLMTWSKIKTLKKTLNALILKVSTMSDLRGPLEYQEEALIHLFYVQKWSNPTLFEP